MPKFVWIFIVFIFFSCAFGCQKAEEKTQENAIPVEVTQIQLGQIKKNLQYNGDIKAELEVRVFSKIPDRIEAYFVEEGDPVKKGDTIAKVLATSIEHNVQQAEAGLSALKTRQLNLKSDYERTQNLLKVDAVSKQQFESIKTQFESLTAQVDQAEAVLATAKSQLKDATIASPMSGIIGNRSLEPGDMAMPSLPVATVVQMDNVKIQFEATETDLANLGIGQDAEIQVRSYPDRVFLGKLTKISPVLDPLTRMATVDVMIPNPNHLLKPGMFANISVTTGILNDIIVIPRFAVLEKTTLKSIDGKEQVSKNFFVYVVNNQTHAEQRLLDVAYVNHMHIAVQSGLDVGDTLVISGQNSLRDGLPVIITASREE